MERYYAMLIKGSELRMGDWFYPVDQTESEEWGRPLVSNGAQPDATYFYSWVGMPPGTGGSVPAEAKEKNVELIARRVDQLKEEEAFVRKDDPHPQPRYIFMGKNRLGELFAQFLDSEGQSVVVGMSPDDLVCPVT